jgi:hypothetical protein
LQESNVKLHIFKPRKMEQNSTKLQAWPLRAGGRFRQGSWGAFVFLCEGWDYFNDFGHTSIHWNGLRGQLHLGGIYI